MLKASTVGRTMCRISTIGFVGYFLSASSSILADDDAESLAAELANPNTTLGQMNFPIDYVSYKGDLPGADNQESWRLSFQAVLPYPLAQGVNLFVRPLIPILYEQAIPIVSGGDTSPPDAGGVGTADANFFDSDLELGDISFDIAIGKTLPSKTILLGGIVGTLDTATDENVGLGQTLLGPEVAVAQLFDWGVLVSHQWDAAGDSDFDHQHYRWASRWPGVLTSSAAWNYRHCNRRSLPPGPSTSHLTKFCCKPRPLTQNCFHVQENATIIRTARWV